MDYKKLIKTTPPTRRPTLLPRPPKTVASISAEAERDALGNEHYHARLRDHTGAVRIPEQVTFEDVDGRGRKVKYKVKEPVYRRLGEGVGPPQSERECRCVRL